jgi:hypothetical protein
MLGFLTLCLAAMHVKACRTVGVLEKSAPRKAWQVRLTQSQFSNTL